MGTRNKAARGSQGLIVSIASTFVVFPSNFDQKSRTVELTVESGKKYQMLIAKQLGTKGMLHTAILGGTVGAIGGSLFNTTSSPYICATIGAATGLTTTQDSIYVVSADFAGTPLVANEDRTLAELEYLGSFTNKHVDLLRPGPNKAIVNLEVNVSACSRVLLFDGEIASNIGVRAKGQIYVPEGEHYLSVSFDPDPKKSTLGCPGNENRFIKYLQTKAMDFKAGHHYTLTFEDGPWTRRKLELTETTTPVK